MVEVLKSQELADHPKLNALSACSPLKRCEERFEWSLRLQRDGRPDGAFQN
jgi:hypothetical protein